MVIVATGNYGKAAERINVFWDVAVVSADPGKSNESNNASQKIGVTIEDSREPVGDTDMSLQAAVFTDKPGNYTRSTTMS